MSFQLLFPNLRMMESTSDFDLASSVQSVSIDTSRYLSSPHQFEQSHMTRISLDGTSAFLQEFKTAAPTSKTIRYPT